MALLPVYGNCYPCLLGYLIVLSHHTLSLDLSYIFHSLFLDGLFFYLRRGNVDKEPVIFALGIKETREYELLGFYLTVKESHNTYKDVLEDLYNRGLKEPLLIVADGIKNLDEEVMEIYPGSEFQLCTIDYARGLKSNVREKDIEEITIDANKMFKCDNKEEAIIKSMNLRINGRIGILR